MGGAWWRFSDTIDRTIDLTSQANGSLDFPITIEDFSTINRQRQNIYMKIQIEKKP